MDPSRAARARARCTLPANHGVPPHARITIALTSHRSAGPVLVLLLLAWPAARAAAASPVHVPTTRLRLDDDHQSPVDVRHRKITFRTSTARSAPESRVVPPARGGAADPTLHGATIAVANMAGSGESVVYPLPATGWTALGSDAHPLGFQFRGDPRTAPISSVIVRKDSITARGSGFAWSYTLDEPTQGRVGLRLTLGDATWCAAGDARTGGKPASSERYDRVDRFEAMPNGAPPPSCPAACTTVPPTLRAAENPDTDQSVELESLLATAAGSPDPAIGQGRLYIAPGLHRFAEVDVPSGVRIEVAPEATLTAPVEPSTGDKYEHPLFRLGQTSQVSRITITAGDGCGGPGQPKRTSKLASTGERGNSEANGMSNLATLPHDPRWPIETMFTFDLDAHFRNVPSATFAVLIGWAKDVELSRFFSIQNPERILDPVTGEPTGPTVNYSRNPVVKPRAIAGSTVSAPRLPENFKMEWVYNVLSPSGWGPLQVQACLGCTVSHVFSHGGVALRLETDHAAPLCGHDQCGGGCVRNGVVAPPTDEPGNGFTTFARIDDLTGSDIEGALGNAVFTLAPHCQRNGTVDVDGVRGTSMGALVSIGQGGATNGSFASDSHVANVVGAFAASGKAQDPMPQLDTYDLYAPQVGLNWAPKEYTATTGGTFCWPAALRDINLPASAQPPVPTFTHAGCPAP
jgi:hypothetical protein